MPSSVNQDVVQRIHESGKQFVLLITGGGSRAIASLLEVPGGSATMLEAVVPYSARALQKWLGGPVDHYCSERTARAMAMAAYERARKLTETDPHSLRGIGATASLISKLPKRGPHRVHVAWQSADTTVSLSCQLAKGQRTRAEEEAVAAQLILAAVCEACGIVAAGLLEQSVLDALQRREQRAPLDWTELLLGRRTCVKIYGSSQVGERDESAAAEADRPQVLFPGAFNPLHAGHERMAELAAERYGVPVVFELSIANVDKPSLDFIELADRLKQLAGRRVLLTRAATFAEKALVAPACIFIVGLDTLIRIGDARYYGGDAGRREAAIATIAGQGCRFLVFGRTVDDRFMTLSDVELPAQLRELCDEVPESMFRVDMSSTDLRNQ